MTLHLRTNQPVHICRLKTNLKKRRLRKKQMRVKIQRRQRMKMKKILKR